MKKENFSPIPLFEEEESSRSKVQILPQAFVNFIKQLFTDYIRLCDFLRIAIEKSLHGTGREIPKNSLGERFRGRDKMKRNNLCEVGSCFVRG